MIARAGPLFVVARCDGAFVGHARMELLGEPANAFKRARRLLHVHEMGVCPAHRRQGVGRALLGAARALAAEHGADGMSLDVYAFNDEARALYEREGFVPVRMRMES